MAQRTTGIHTILSPSWGYSLFQSLVGAKRSRRLLAKEHLKLAEGDRILDIGCGTGEILDVLPVVHYVGFDLSPQYIAAAREKYGERGIFHVADVEQVEFDVAEKFNIVVAIGVLHHLDDGDSSQLLSLSHRVLVEGGRLVTVDPTYVEGQSRTARFLIGLDRGLNIRPENELCRLANQYFEQVSIVIRHDLLHIPYSHVIMECVR